MTARRWQFQREPEKWQASNGGRHARRQDVPRDAGARWSAAMEAVDQLSGDELERLAGVVADRLARSARRSRKLAAARRTNVAAAAAGLIAATEAARMAVVKAAARREATRQREVYRAEVETRRAAAIERMRAGFDALRGEMAPPEPRITILPRSPDWPVEQLPLPIAD